MNWSAFFQGGPAGLSQGMDWSQRYNQNQQMNPLLLQHQQLQNQQMQQNISHGGQQFDWQKGVYGLTPPSMQGYGQQLGMQGQVPQGTTPTARQQGSMPNMDNIIAGPQAWGGGNVFGNFNPYGADVPNYQQIGAGAQMATPDMLGSNTTPGSYTRQGMMQNPWGGWGGQ